MSTQNQSLSNYETYELQGRLLEVRYRLSFTQLLDFLRLDFGLRALPTLLLGRIRWTCLRHLWQ